MPNGAYFLDSLEEDKSNSGFPRVYSPKLDIPTMDDGACKLHVSTMDDSAWLTRHVNHG